MSDHRPKSSQSHIGLPTPSVQNQIHELAKTLPPPRRQNIACDACRARKVKCHQIPGTDKCQHCTTKNYPCTHYIQQATSEKKRSSAVSRRNRTLSTSSSSSPPASVSKLSAKVAAIAHRRVLTPPSPSSQSESSNAPTTPAASSPSFSPGPASHPLPLPYQQVRLSSSPHSGTLQLLAYLFSPEGTTDPSAFTRSRGRAQTIQQWGEISRKLEDEVFRIEFALDLVEVFFQICHTRLPLLNPAQFRARLQFALTPPTSTHRIPPEVPLHPALLATVIAWGAKFSEHPLLVLDREMSGNGSSRVAKVLVNRAREVAEAEKVHRLSTVDHVVIALLIEPLQSQNPDDPDGFHGFWLTCAIRHLLDLQINHKSVMSNISDPESRGTMIFAWWMACLSDAYHSAYYRKKPILDDDDYDIDFYTVGPVPSEPNNVAPAPSPREQLEFLGYYTASHALARVARQMSKQFWRPTTESDGLPLDVIINTMNALNDWRNEHLPRVGVPSDFEAEWDFVSAVSACGSDAYYHVMWVILFNAVDDFGIREIIEVIRMGNMAEANSSPQIESVKHKLLDEALHAALRIAGLTGVLTSNGYLKLDPAVMHFSCLTSGTLLARLGRPEVSNCVAGLKQYSYAYDEASEEAAELERTYNAAVSGDTDLNHMANVVLSGPGGSGSGAGGGVGVSALGSGSGANTPTGQGQGMVVDHPHPSQHANNHNNLNHLGGNGIGTHGYGHEQKVGMGHRSMSNPNSDTEMSPVMQDSNTFPHVLYR